MGETIVNIFIVVLALSVATCGEDSEGTTHIKPASVPKKKTEATRDEVAAKKAKAGLKGKSTPAIIEGDLYVFPSKDRDYFAVMKVIAVDKRIIHLMRYANKLKDIPKDLDPAELTLGELGAPGNIAVDHMPLSVDWFWPSEPVFVKNVRVTPNDLTGYYRYKNRN